MKPLLAIILFIVVFSLGFAQTEDKSSAFQQEIRKALRLLNSHQMEKYQEQVLFIEKNFTEFSDDVSYLIQRGSFAQTIDAKDPERAKKIFLEIINKDPVTVKVPDNGLMNSKNTKNREDAVNFLKRGTIWAMLNNKAAGYTSMKDKKEQKKKYREAVNDVIKELEATSEGRRCIPFARQWEIVMTAPGTPWKDYPVAASFLPRETPPPATAVRQTAPVVPIAPPVPAVTVVPPKKIAPTPSVVSWSAIPEPPAPPATFDYRKLLLYLSIGLVLAALAVALFPAKRK